MERFRKMIDQGMLVVDSDGNTIGKVGERHDEWFNLERPDGARLQVWYDTVQNILGYTVVLNIPKSELLGRAA